MTWLRATLWSPCKCENAPALCPAAVSRAPVVPATSPARLLAKSLTDPETRGEWEAEKSDFKSTYTHSTTYNNKTRDIYVRRSRSLDGCAEIISTPFSLDQQEQRIVGAAIDAFCKHLSDVAQQAALARLTADPAKARKGKAA